MTRPTAVVPIILLIGGTLAAGALLVSKYSAVDRASANARAACIMACETTAQACLNEAHATYDACKPAANSGCANTPPADKFNCLTTALKSCSTNRSSQTEPCRTAAHVCYVSCGARPDGQSDFWCELDASSTASGATLRKATFCEGDPSLGHADQHARCIARLTTTEPTMGYSLSCDPMP